MYKSKVFVIFTVINFFILISNLFLVYHNATDHNRKQVELQQNFEQPVEGDIKYEMVSLSFSSKLSLDGIRTTPISLILPETSKITYFKASAQSGTIKNLTGERCDSLLVPYKSNVWYSVCDKEKDIIEINCYDKDYNDIYQCEILVLKRNEEFYLTVVQ